MAEGWVSLNRKTASSDLWLSEPFTRGQAWVDMIMLANHTEGFIRLKSGHRLDVLRGQLGYSENTLAKRWKWSRGKVRRFFSELETESKIVRKTVQGTVQGAVQRKTIITLCNYNKYNDIQNNDGTEHGTTNGTHHGHVADMSRYNNYNGNQDNNENKESSREDLIDESDILTPAQVATLKASFGTDHSGLYEGKLIPKTESDYRHIQSEGQIEFNHRKNKP